MPLLRAFRLQAEEEGYEDKLESVSAYRVTLPAAVAYLIPPRLCAVDRVSAIESLAHARGEQTVRAMFCSRSV